MSAPKPHIKPKADPSRQRTEPRPRDAPADGEYDPPLFPTRDADPHHHAGERVLFNEDDCLR